MTNWDKTYLNLKMLITLNINSKINKDVKEVNYKENNVNIEKTKSE